MNEQSELFKVKKKKKKPLQAEVHSLKAGEKFKATKNIKMQVNGRPRSTVKNFRNMKSVKVLPIKLTIKFSLM